MFSSVKWGMEIVVKSKYINRCKIFRVRQREKVLAITFVLYRKLFSSNPLMRLKTLSYSLRDVLKHLQMSLVIISQST